MPCRAAVPTTDRMAANKPAPQFDRKPPVTLRYSCWPQFPFAAVVVGWCVGMVQECEQVASAPAVTLSQSLAVPICRSQYHDGVQIAVQPTLIGTTRAFGQFRAPSRQSDRAQQQRLHAGSEDLIAGFDGVLAVAQLVRQRQTDLQRSACPCWAL